MNDTVDISSKNLLPQIFAREYGNIGLKLPILFTICALLFHFVVQADGNIQTRTCVATEKEFDRMTTISSQIVLNWQTDSATLSFAKRPWQRATLFHFVYVGNNLSVAISENQEELAELTWQDSQNATLKVGDRLSPLPSLGKYRKYDFNCGPSVY